MQEKRSSGLRARVGARTIGRTRMVPPLRGCQCISEVKVRHVPNNFADRMLEAIARKKTPAVIALDPVYSRLPAAIAEHRELNDEADVEAALDASLEFCRQVIRIVSPLVPAVKINSAYFERYYSEGIEGYYELVQEAADRDLLVIGDVKRADIGP